MVAYVMRAISFRDFVNLRRIYAPEGMLGDENDNDTARRVSYFSLQLEILFKTFNYTPSRYLL